MPQKTLPYQDNTQDKRRRLTDEEREQIKQLYTTTKATFRGLGRRFGVDRHTIKAIVDPKWYKNKLQQRYDKKPWLDYYDKEQWKLTQRKHRKRKRELNLITRADTITLSPQEATHGEIIKHYKTNHQTLKHNNIKPIKKSAA